MVLALIAVITPSSFANGTPLIGSSALDASQRSVFRSNTAQTSPSTTEANDWTDAPHSVYVAVDDLNCAKTSCDDIEREAADVIDLADEFWSDVSDGRIRFTQVDANGDAPGRVNRFETDADCKTEERWEAAALAVQAAAGLPQSGSRAFIFDRNGNVLLVLSDCGNTHGLRSSVNDVPTHGGMAELMGWQGRFAGRVATALAPVVGFRQASTIDCGRAPQFDVLLPTDESQTESRGCRLDPFSDVYDVAGLAMRRKPERPWPLSPSAPSLHRVGLLPDDNVLQMGSTSGRFTISLAAITSREDAPRAVRITDPATGDAYWLEFRNATGVDADASYGKEHWDGWLYDSHDNYPLDVLRPGVRVLKVAQSGSTAALLGFYGDVKRNPETGRTEEARAWAMKKGQSFTSRSGALSVHVTRTNGDFASITIEIDDDVQDAASVWLERPYIRFGQQPTIHAAVDGVHPLNGTLDIEIDAKRFARTSEPWDEQTVTPDRVLSGGVHEVRARFTAGSSGTSALATTPLTVYKATSRSTSSLKSDDLESGQLAMIRVKVSTNVPVPPTGHVQARMRGELVAESALRNSDEGAVTLRVPQQWIGKHVFELRYTGDRNYASSSTKAKVTWHR